MKTQYKTKFHRDGSVTVWNVYSQTWQRKPASMVLDTVLATLPHSERNRICAHAQKSR